MEIIRKVKALVNTFVLKAKGKETTYDQQHRLSDFQEKFKNAWTNYDISFFDKLELRYLGTNEVDKDPNSKSNKATKKASTVRNICYENVESQVNTVLPKPNVKSERKGFEEYAKMIQQKIEADMAKMDFEEFNDLNERNTPIHGISIAMLDWDNSKKGVDYIGEKVIKLLHAKQFLPQPNIYDIDKMEYNFIISSVTKEYIKRRYKISVTSELEEKPEINSLNDSSFTNETSTTNSKDKVTEIVCFYKDGDGDIGKFVWVNDTVLEDFPKYYYPRVHECKECGYEFSQEEKECPECKSKKYTKKTKETEKLNEDKYLDPISYGQIVKTVEVDPQTGKKTIKKTDEEIIVERIIPAGTEIPIYVPKKYPVAVRNNIKRNFRFSGVSDIEVVEGLQNQMNMLLSKASGKILGAPTMIGMPEKMDITLTTDLYSVIEGKRQDIDAIKKIDLQVSAQQDIDLAERTYGYAKSILGITDSFQGKYDPSAKSGRAKQAQIEQTAGRLASKVVNKFAFYKNIFELMFCFDLAFSKEPRYYLRKDERGRDDWGEFDKYNLLMQDASGEWFYNTEFRFSADVGDALPNDKMFMYEQTQALFAQKALTMEQLWAELDALDFPLARVILEDIRSTKDKEQEGLQEKYDIATAIMGMLSNLSPEEQIAFLQQPMERQMQMVENVLTQNEQEGQRREQAVQNQNAGQML